MLFCYVLVSGEQDVNFFLFDGRRKGPVLSKSKGDIKENLVHPAYQCSKMLARGMQVHLPRLVRKVVSCSLSNHKANIKVFIFLL